VFEEQSTLAVTGGAGRYKTAHGVLTIETTGEQGLDFIAKLLL
jgi:hypothetical protein